MRHTDRAWVARDRSAMSRASSITARRRSWQRAVLMPSGSGRRASTTAVTAEGDRRVVHLPAGHHAHGCAEVPGGISRAVGDDRVARREPRERGKDRMESSRRGRSRRSYRRRRERHRDRARQGSWAGSSEPRAGMACGRRTPRGMVGDAAGRNDRPMHRTCRDRPTLRGRRLPHARRANHRSSPAPSSGGQPRTRGRTAHPGTGSRCVLHGGGAPTLS